MKFGLCTAKKTWGKGLWCRDATLQHCFFLSLHGSSQVEHGNPVRKGWGRTIPSIPLACKRHGFGPKWGIVLGMYLILSKSLPAVGKTPGLKLSLANLAKCCNDQTWKSLRACQAIWQDRCLLFYLKCSLFTNRGHKILLYFMAVQIFLQCSAIKKIKTSPQSLGICGRLETSLRERWYSFDR